MNESKDWTLEGTHLCMVRLELMRLNTMPALDPARLADVAALRTLSSKELRALGRREQAPGTGHRLECILREEKRVILAQPLALRLNEAGVRRVVGRDFDPVGLEVALDAVLLLQGEVRRLLLLEQVVLGPGGAVEDGGSVAG